MDTEELIEALQEAGLSPYQANAYVAVLELGTGSATEIANRGGVPAPRIYDVLDALEEKEYVETYEQGSLRARAHSPTDVLEDLRSRAGRLEEAAMEVEERWEQPELESNTASIVKRFRTVIDRAEQFVDEAEHSIQLSATVEHFERLRPALARAHDRGVSIRVSVHTHPDELPPDPSAFEGVCHEARHRRLPAPFVALIDRQRTCFAHHPDSYERYGVLVDDRTHTYIFHWYFLTCQWEHWETVHSTQSDELPRAYVDIRYCVRDLQPLLEDGAHVEATVEGHDLETGDDVALSGDITDALYAPSPPENEIDAVLQLAGQVTILVDTGEEEVSVGGWGAVIEDVEATRITIERITPIDEQPNATDTDAADRPQTPRSDT